MPRNSSGTMVPANGPYISGTTISSVAINARFADEEGELGDSLSRSGKGGMLAVLRGVDGTVAAPAYSYTSETGTGWFKSAAGEIAAALAGVLAAKFTSTGIKIFGAARAFLQSVDANSVVQILGNRNAADVGADVETNGQVTRTAGLLLQVNNNSTPKLLVDYLGLARLDAGAAAAAIQPGSLWTAITPASGWTAGAGLSYCKDAMGFVHLRGTVTFSTGAAANAFTLPAGFRPSASRIFAGVDPSVPAAAIEMWIDSGGAFNLGVTATNAHAYYVDSITYMAEA